jgi:hypothetical protein
MTATLDGELSSFLVEWLKARFSVWRRFGPWILIVTDPAWDRDAAAQLDRLVKSVRADTRLLTVSIDLHAAGREGAFPARLRVPVLDGSSATFVLGRGRTGVVGYEVEVAQGAAVPDPVVGVLFDGFALALDIDGTTCDVRGIAQLFDRAVATLDCGYDVLGPLERPEPRVLRFDERLRLSEGPQARARIGSASERPDPAGLSLEISVASGAR